MYLLIFKSVQFTPRSNFLTRSVWMVFIFFIDRPRLSYFHLVARLALPIAKIAIGYKELWLAIKSSKRADIGDKQKKSPTMNFISSSVTLHFRHCNLTVSKPYRHTPQAIFIFDIQLTYVFAAHLTRLSSCIINGYG